MWVTSNQTRCVFNIYPTPQNAPNTWELERPIGKLPGPSNQHASICNYNLAVKCAFVIFRKKLLCTLIFCATTPKGDKQNFVAEITMNVLKRYGYTFSSIGLWQTAGLVRVHTKPKSLSHSNQTKFKGVYGQSSFPWTAESKCFYAMPLVFSSNVNECWKWMRST